MNSLKTNSSDGELKIKLTEMKDWHFQQLDCWNSFFFLIFLFMAMLSRHRCRSFSLVAANRGYSLVVVASHFGGFSCYGAWALEPGVRSCGAQASLLHSMWESSWSRDRTCVSCILAVSLPLSHQGSPDCSHFWTRNLNVRTC